jgi:flavin reductase (DIM6/NTAB) family NADH-FMN oxidoreductase RutF
MQVGLEPPTVCVAVGKTRTHLEAMRASGRFALSQLDKESARLMTTFLKKPAGGASPFDGLALQRTPGGSTVLTDALAWLECEVRGEHDAGDHVVVFGTVVAGELLREGDPRVHLRKDGLGY